MGGLRPPILTLEPVLNKYIIEMIFEIAFPSESLNFRDLGKVIIYILNWGMLNLKIVGDTVHLFCP